MTKIMVIITIGIIMVISGISAQKSKLLVGDDNGWGLSPTSDFFGTWAAKQNFVVGDTLVFDFSTGSHTVATVTSKEAYEKCDPMLDENAVVVDEGPYEITLKSAGQFYYFCTISSHCANGRKAQKFAANVSATPLTTPSGPPSSAGALATSRPGPEIT